MRRAAIIGPGRVGTALALGLKDVMQVLGAAGGSLPSRQRFAQVTGFAANDDAAALCARADWIFLTVPDRAVRTVCERLARSGAFRPDQVVCHTSGSLTSEALASARDEGAAVVALHPMQSIAEGSRGREAFEGATCSLEGDASALDSAQGLVRALGMHPWRVRPEQKARLHAASVLASNALVGLLALAADAAADRPGDPKARALALSALLPLSQGTLRNLGALGLPEALTGPVERGDVSTVRLHLELLGGEAARVYRSLVPTLVHLAEEKGSPGARAAEEFLQRSGEANDP